MRTTSQMLFRPRPLKRGSETPKELLARLSRRPWAGNQRHRHHPLETLDTLNTLCFSRDFFFSRVYSIRPRCSLQRFIMFGPMALLFYTTDANSLPMAVLSTIVMFFAMSAEKETLHHNRNAGFAVGSPLTNPPPWHFRLLIGIERGEPTLKFFTHLDLPKVIRYEFLKTSSKINSPYPLDFCSIIST